MNESYPLKTTHSIHRKVHSFIRLYYIYFFQKYKIFLLSKLSLYSSIGRWHRASSEHLLSSTYTSLNSKKISFSFPNKVRIFLVP